MRVGIFLGYGPDVVLGKEGLGRYLGNLIKNLQAAGSQVTVACPKWLSSTLEDVCEDFFIDVDAIEFIMTDKMPALWRVYHWKTRRRRGKRTKLFQKGMRWGANMLVGMLASITNLFLFFLLLFVALCLIAALLPFAVMGSLAYWLFALARSAAGKCSDRAKAAWKRLARLYEAACYEGIQTFMVIYYRFTENTQRQLVKKINRSPQLDIWYSPAVFWPAFHGIKGKKVINVPDLVTEEFATKWASRKEILYSSKMCEKTISKGSHFITYSNYIRQSLLMHRFGKDGEDILVIPHGVNDMGQYVAISGQVACGAEMAQAFTKSYCKGLLQTLAPHTREAAEYMKGYRFDDVEYIFYPSQLRPHKNILNLVRAYEYLLRKKYVRVKLVFTCKLEDDPDLTEYIFSHRLQYDVLFFNNVSVQQLAALYSCAALAVCPTLYEGGFPFTFGEGMSVGTPSVMGRIPQVLEVVDGYGWDNCLFDPYDYKDIADKIQYGLGHREELAQRQKALFDDLKRRTWEGIGKEYVEAFEYFMGREEGERAC